MKTFSVLGRFATCLLGILGVCMASPESAAAKVKIVTTSVTVHHSGGLGGASPTTIVCELTCDGYVNITTDAEGNTQVYNNDSKYSTDPEDLIDLSSDEIKALNSATEGKVDPDYFNWNMYKLQVEGVNTTASPIHVQMNGGEIGELVLGGGNISTIDLTITGGSLNRFVFTGVVFSDCKVSISNCAIRDFNSLIYDSEYSLIMNSWRYLTFIHGSGVIYTYPHEMIENIKSLQSKGATIDMSFKPTTNNVYEINDATDFYWFEDYVNNGRDNMNGKLMNDIEIVSNTMIGTNEHPYSYEFDGNGHKISGLDFKKIRQMEWNSQKIDYAGLFGYVNGTSSNTAIIKNLTVEGSIVGPGNSGPDLFVAGGVVGIAEQYVKISDVVSNVNISNVSNVKAHIGGIAGTTESDDNGPLYLERCTFTGSISQRGSNCCGGIVGYIHKGYLQDCLNAGTVTNAGNVEGSWVSGILGYVNDWDDCGFTMKRCLNVGKVSGNNSYAIGFANNCAASAFDKLYYKAGAATPVTNGTAKFGTSVVSLKEDQLKSGEYAYVLNGNSSSAPTWYQTLGSDTVPVLDKTHKVVYNTYADCLSEVQYSNENNNRTYKGHSYANGFCTYCKAVDPDYLKANSEGYYEIANLTQLKWFAAYVNAGHESVKARLTKDVTQAGNVMIGTHNHPFKGEFDGNGFQISGLNQVSDFGKYNETTDYAGLFGYVLGTSSEHAVIKNLTVKGTITYGTSTGSSATYFTAGGVVGIADQYVEIADVVSDVNINIERNVKTHVGGVAGTNEIGTANGPLYLDRCTYRGTIKQRGHDACAGIVGCICSGHVYDCVNFGTIQNVDAADNSWVSGIVGYASNNSAANFSIKRCLNIGTVSGNGSYAFGYLRNCPAGSFDNLYYKSGSATSDKMGTADFGESIHEVSADQLKSGEVAYALNGGNTTTPTWYQTIGTDDYPVFYSSHKVVYSTYANCNATTLSFSNVNNGHTKKGHNYADGFCTYCKAVDPDYLKANSEGYYEIGNLKQLKWFAAYVNAGNGSVKGKLTKDVSQAGNVMIGTHDHPFKGEFDGNGFQISGLNQVSDFGKYNETTEYSGLFGFVQGESDTKPAVIKNLKVEGTIKLAASTESSTTYFVAGGVVGIADQYVKVADVVSYVNITNERNIKTHIGGIVGTTQYSDANGPLYLDKCVYRGTIKQSGSNACGGIVGYINKGHIHDCVNAGTITNVGGANNSWVCGILGYVNNSSADNFSVKRCLNVGKVSGSCSYAIGYAKACPSSDFELLYYMSDTIAATNGTADFGESIHKVSADQLKSGEVAYALNGGNTTTPTWYQTIGTDDYPVFDSSHKVVYNTYADCESTVQYSNVNNGRTHQGHLWDEGTITTQPTCTVVGVRTCTCTFGCGTQQGFDVAANGHSEEVIPAVAATCTKTGLTEGTKCSVCQETLKAQEEVAAKGHTEEIIPAEEPTCTGTGLTEGKKCSVCHETLLAQTEVPAKGHIRGELKSDYSAHWYACVGCWEELDYESHNHDAADHSCSVCGVDVPAFAEDGLMIDNSKQLYWLMGYLKDHSNVPVKLTDDIVLNENLLNESGELNLSEEDLPVWQASCFGGTFDGQGHYISGLYSKNPYDKAGLFLTLEESATVRNLEIRDSYFEASYAGAITAIAGGGTIQNCASVNNVIKGDKCIGGLVGTGRLKIASCFSTCQLQMMELEGADEANAGLLVGCIDPDAMSEAFDATIQNCFFATDSELGAVGKVKDSYDPEHHTFSTLRVEKKDLSAFRSGEVAYLLNETYSKDDDTWTSNEETPVWRQNLLGTQADAVPVLDPSHKKVVYVQNAENIYTVKDGKQYGTFCYGLDVALPAGIDAFYSTAVLGEKILGIRIEEGVIPAGTPVILRKPAKVDDVTLSIAEGYNNKAVRQLGDTCVSGQLVGLLKVTAGQTLPQGASPFFTYTMQTIDGAQNFYQISSGDFPATQYRCYLDLSIGGFSMEAVMSRAEYIFEGEVNGLQQLSAEDQDVPAYNLQGQRVQRMDRRGIYVQGNKKTLIK